MKAGAHAVKLEGGAQRAETVKLLTEAGIPVVAHLGYTPQSENALGGPRVQGRGEGAQILARDTHALADAGAFAVVFEMVPEPIATQLSQELSIITIGIGAGHTPTAGFGLVGYGRYDLVVAFLCTPFRADRSRTPLRDTKLYLLCSRRLIPLNRELPNKLRTTPQCRTQLVPSAPRLAISNLG